MVHVAEVTSPGQPDDHVLTVHGCDSPISRRHVYTSRGHRVIVAVMTSSRTNPPLHLFVQFQGRFVCNGLFTLTTDKTRQFRLVRVGRVNNPLEYILLVKISLLIVATAIARSITGLHWLRAPECVSFVTYRATDGAACPKRHLQPCFSRVSDMPSCSDRMHLSLVNSLPVPKMSTNKAIQKN